MQVSVIIVTYNDYNHTAACLRSIFQHVRNIDFEVILVDNNSTKVNPQCFADEFPEIMLLHNMRNGGFADGNNFALTHARGDYILLLNNDTILHENSVKIVYDYLSSNPDVGVVGCRMVYPSGKVQFTARKFRSITWEIFDTVKFIPFIFPYKKRARLMLGKYFKHDEDIDCDWVNGAFFMFPKKLLALLPKGKLDDRFFMSAEDQLWCEQFKQLGYKIRFYSGTTITHVSGASETVGSSDFRKQLSFRSTMLKNELEVMRNRKGRGVYYVVFALLYGTKERVRNGIKQIVFDLFGKKIL